jgi:hypothetical protein
VGIAGRWDAEISDSTRIDEHRVAPLSLAAAGLAFESQSGLTALALSGETGWVWSSQRGWGFTGRARATLERVLFAVNDLPVSVFAAGGYDASESRWNGEAGLRIALPTTSGGPR